MRRAYLAWAFIMLLACGGVDIKEDDSIPVTVLIPHVDVICSVVAVPCRLESENDALVSALHPGRIDIVLTSVGDSVTAGDVLMELSTDQQYRSAVSASVAGITSSRTLLENAERNLARASHILDEGGMSLSEYQLVESRVAASEASLMSAISTYQGSKSMESSGRITAPFDGVISRIMAREGEIASGPLLSISTRGVLRTELLVSEYHMQLLSDGLPVSFSTPHYPGSIFSGTVVSHSHSVDPESGLVPVIVQFSDTTGTLRSGMTGIASIATETSEDAVVLPQRVLRPVDGSTWEAVLVQDGRAVIVPVKTGITNGSRLEILEGVCVGDSVVQLGHHLVDAGSQLRVVER